MIVLGASERLILLQTFNELHTLLSRIDSRGETVGWGIFCKVGVGGEQGFLDFREMIFQEMRSVAVELWPSWIRAQ